MKDEYDFSKMVSTREVTAALAKFQKLRESGFWCCLEINCDYDYVTTISLTPSGFAKGKRYDKEDKHEPSIIVNETEVNGLKGLVKAINQAVKEATEYEKVIKSRP